MSTSREAGSGLLDSLKRPWLLSEAQKCRLASLLVLIQAAPFLGYALLFKLKPGAVPFIDQAALAQTLILLLLIFGAFLGTFGLSFLAPARPRLASVLPYVFCQLFAIAFVMVAYEVGQYTSDITGGVLLTGCIVGLLLFDRFAVLLGMGSGLLLMFVVTVLSQADVIPYAPLLVRSPVQGHHLSGLWLASLGGVVLAIEVVACAILYYFLYRLRDHEAELAQVRAVISSYVPAQVVQMIAEGASFAAQQYARRKLTLFFSDVVGFTEIAERLEPEDLSRILNEYFTEMTLIAERYDGTVDELSGDAILIFFGAPRATSDADHAMRAVNMAMEMQQAVAVLNATWMAQGIDVALRVRMGIDTGVVTVGNFGSRGRMKYAAIGKHVNTAARLQASCVPDRLLISHSTWLLVRERVTCVPRGQIELKGIHHPVMSYEVGGERVPLLRSVSSADETSSPSVFKLRAGDSAA